jgi:bifunctional non-homologous end joining protein LigD
MLTTPTAPLETVNLHYREGTSDKVYQVCIQPAGPRFVVNFAYGRRGSSLNTGTKTNVPVDLPAAQRIFTQLVKSKKAKGYTETTNGTPHLHDEAQPTTIRPQLLNRMDEDQVLDLMQDDQWCMQEKHDGRRLLVHKAGAQIVGLNKQGQTVGLSQSLFQVVRELQVDVLLDGESLGDCFVAFDLLELNGEDLRAWPYRERLTALLNLLFSAQQRVIRPVETAFTSEQKLTLLTHLRKARREGAVFKQLQAPYTPGRPYSGGPQLKHKFVATLSALVTRLNPQRSVGLSLFGRNGWQTAGNVTIPPNHSVPIPGTVIEVRYLYAFPESDVLFQPVYLGRREDVDPHECTIAQLKYKPTDDE